MRIGDGMRIGYFGGSFDPPHRGHLAVAEAARDHFGLDRVTLAPTGRQPLKPGGASAPFADRLVMTALLCEGSPGLEASAIDAPHADGSPNYTADTLGQMRGALPAGARLFALVGADAFLGLPQWHHADQLFALAEWIVVSRPGFPWETIDALPLTAGQRARVHRLPAVNDPTSATSLRSRLGAQEACDDLLPGRVCDYIRAHELYNFQVS